MPTVTLFTTIDHTSTWAYIREPELAKTLLNQD